MKEQEIVRERMNTMQLVVDYVGVYYSKEWVRKNILWLTDEEIEEIDKQIEKEAAEEPKEEEGEGEPPAPTFKVVPTGDEADNKKDVK
jgi:hypothetical protein